MKKKTAPQPPKRQLPPPLMMAMSLSEAFKKRRTSRDFSEDPICDEDLSTLLWAADGITRKDGRRTTPSAMNWQEIDIYVVKANAVWLWNAEQGALTLVKEQDHRSDFTLLQPLVKKAPVHLVYVVSQDRTAGLVTDLAKKMLKYVEQPTLKEEADRVIDRAKILDVGVKVQAVYMAAAALNINCLVRMTFDPDRVRKTLGLNPGDEPVCIETLGYRPKSLLDLAL